VTACEQAVRQCAERKHVRATIDELFAARARAPCAEACPRSSWPVDRARVSAPKSINLACPDSRHQHIARRSHRSERSVARANIDSGEQRSIRMAHNCATAAERAHPAHARATSSWCRKVGLRRSRTHRQLHTFGCAMRDRTWNPAKQRVGTRTLSGRRVHACFSAKRWPLPLKSNHGRPTARSNPSPSSASTLKLAPDVWKQRLREAHSSQCYAQIMRWRLLARAAHGGWPSSVCSRRFGTHQRERF